ncbi:MAG: fibronectin type III domain-containing protein, partial [Bacteroidota bacterium]
IPTADDISINTMGALSGAKTVPLGFKTTVAGTFTITADMVSSLTSNGNYVYLRDIETGVVQNLAANNTYQFTSGVTNGLKRFVLLFNPPLTVFPSIALTSNALSVAGGTTSVNLPYSGTTNSPDKYSIDFDATANTAGFVDITDVNLPASPIVISIPSTVSPGIYNALLSVKISTTGAVSTTYPITIEVQTTFTKSMDIGTTVTLSWTPTSGASSYVIQYRVPAGVWIGASSGTASQAKLTNLTEETLYECRVITFKNGIIYSTSAIGNFTTDLFSYTKSYDMGTTQQISWPSLSWASSYVLQYKKSSASTWTGIAATGNQIKLSNLDPETDYDYKLVVFKSNLMYGTAQTGTFTTAKVDFTSSNVTTTSLTLSWTDLAPWATAYTLQYRLPAGVWTGIPSYSNSVNIANLTPATAYECRLYVFKTTQWGLSQAGTFATAGGKAISTENTGNDNQLSVYPNPFTDQVKMDVFVKEDAKLTWNLYDMTGKLVLNGEESIRTGYSTFNINAAELPKGVYMIKATLNDQIQSFRVLKQ